MKLLPWIEERLQKVRLATEVRRLEYGLRKDPGYYTETPNFIDSLNGAHAMLEFALQRPLSHIGFDTEFRYDSPGVIKKKKIKYDPQTIRPLLLSLAMVEPLDTGQGCIYSFVVDLRKPELLPVLGDLFRLPVCFCGHYAKAEIFCMLKLGLTEPSILWDTCIFEKALCLGQYNHKYKLKNVTDDAERIQIKEEAKEIQNFGNSLVATCQRYGVAHRMGADKERLQKSFLDHPENTAFSQEQIEYSAEDAVAAAKLYPLQVHDAVRKGLLPHCQTVEMPWVITNARIEWVGVRIDKGKCEDIIAKITPVKDNLEKYISSKYGLKNTESHKQLKQFFERTGILEKFRRNGEIKFDKDILKENTGLHSSIPFIRAARRASDILSNTKLLQEFIGAGGRARSDHKQLGTDTGRQTTILPNIMGVDRMSRPIIIPDDGNGIGEVDWSQVEVGVAAAVYGDEALVSMFNSGDVYSAMAQNFFKDELPEDDRCIPGKEFKKKHKELRNQMKTCTLGMIYGLTPIGLAPKLGTTINKAKKLQNRFMSMFPVLQSALNQTIQSGAIRGYVATMTGLRRYRGRTGATDSWERNWMANHPVQGSAAVVFKAAGNRLDKLYMQYGARIIIPLHDAFIFEVPLEHLKVVADLTERVMCETLQKYFPVLRPKADVNIDRPDCWNKDGVCDELDQWIKKFIGT